MAYLKYYAIYLLYQAKSPRSLPRAFPRRDRGDSKDSPSPTVDTDISLSRISTLYMEDMTTEFVSSPLSLADICEH